jgi:hypothetical protein
VRGAVIARQLTLKRRPVDGFAVDDFALREVELPRPGPGQVLVRNSHISVDPYMRAMIVQGPTTHVPYEAGRPMSGGAVGEVVASGTGQLSPGDRVAHLHGWRDAALLDATEVSPIDISVAPPSTHLGALGLTGFTAWVGLTQLGRLSAGETVFVTAAAGGVGSVAGQLARRGGAARVIGSAGSPEKARFAVEACGFDAAFDRHDGSPAERLAALAPAGIDVVLDGVGGAQLEAAIGAMRQGGRVVLCGAMSQASIWDPAPGPRNLALAIPKRLLVQGYVASDHERLRPVFAEELAAALADGSLTAHETVVDGLERAPQALLDLLAGRTRGKTIVAL